MRAASRSPEEATGPWELDAVPGRVCLTRRCSEALEAMHVVRQAASARAMRGTAAVAGAAGPVVLS